MSKVHDKVDTFITWWISALAIVFLTGITVLIAACCVAFAMNLISPCTAKAELPTITSDPPTPTVVCYYDPKTNQTLCPTFQTPHLLISTSPSTHIANAPIDATRLLSNLPSYPLAAFHHWLFGFPLQSQTQRQYAACIEAINTLHTLLDPPLPPIDLPSSPEYSTITTIRDYLVPFQAIQNSTSPSLPPTLKDAIAHTEAAISSYNVTVDYLEACSLRKKSLQTKIYTSFTNTKALVSSLQKQISTLKNKCGKKCR